MKKAIVLIALAVGGYLAYSVYEAFTDEIAEEAGFLLPVNRKGETPFNGLLIKFEKLFLSLECRLHPFDGFLQGEHFGLGTDRPDHDHIPAAL